MIFFLVKLQKWNGKILTNIECYLFPWNWCTEDLFLACGRTDYYGKIIIFTRIPNAITNWYWQKEDLIELSNALSQNSNKTKSIALLFFCHLSSFVLNGEINGKKTGNNFTHSQNIPIIFPEIKILYITQC